MDSSISLHWRRYPERYRLEGNHCQTCGQDYFPSRLFCPHCRRKGRLVSKMMPRHGTIASWTKVFVGPKGFENEAPYFLALIDLGNSAQILSQIVDSDETAIKTGANVEKVFRKIADHDPEGAIAYGYKFKVVG
jgi:uncharacterized OB-fold protein